jgi:N6-adenosine-specific RNA methylase IME4
MPKIELNARRRRNGWDCWGAEAPLDLATDDPTSRTAHSGPLEDGGTTVAPQ